MSESHRSRTSARRFLAGLTLAALSAITGIISYSHGLDVVRLVGNRGLVAFLVPLVPDLMIVTSSLTLIEASAVKAPRPPMAMVALVAGIGWTVAMNVAAGARNGPGGALVAAGAPLAFVLTFESLLWLFRRGRGASLAVPPVGAPAARDHPEAATAAPTREWLDGHLREFLAIMSPRELEKAIGVSRGRLEAARAADAPAPGIEVPGAGVHSNGDGS